MDKNNNILPGLQQALGSNKTNKPRTTKEKATKLPEAKGEPKDDFSNLYYSKDVKPQDMSVKLSQEEERDLLRQGQKEYEEAVKHQRPWLQNKAKMLKVYNNQRKDPSRTGDTLTYTVFTTVLSALYRDQIGIEWEADDEGDVEQAENLNSLYKYDYKKMRKAVIDYYWLWNTLFFGRAPIDLSYFERSKMTPRPQLIDPLTMLRDPYCIAINGVAGYKSARYFGYETTVTMEELKYNPAYYNIHEIKQNNTSPSSSTRENLLYDARQARDDAQGLNTLSSLESDDKNAEYKIVEWYTHFKGRKVCVGFANDFQLIVKYKILPLNDRWQIAEKAYSPDSQSYDGYSIPSITEDKQRMKAIQMNLLSDNSKAALHPLLAYNERKIKNKNDLAYGFGKAIGVQGDPSNSVAVLQTERVNLQLASYILNELDMQAQKGTATPEIQQGVMPQEERTLGETNLVQNNSSSRYGLHARVFGWGEAEFAYLWYMSYKLNMDEHIDEKIIRIKGVSGTKFRKLTRENIITAVDPDLTVVSTITKRNEQMQDALKFEKFMQIALQDPTVNKRYMFKKMARLNDMDEEEIDMIFPETADEMIAREENKELSENKPVEIKDGDNHQEHISINKNAADTPATRAHIEAHKRALRLMKTNPDLFPNTPAEQKMQAGVVSQSDVERQQEQERVGVEDVRGAEQSPSDMAQQFSY